MDKDFLGANMNNSLISEWTIDKPTHCLGSTFCILLMIGLVILIFLYLTCLCYIILYGLCQPPQEMPQMAPFHDIYVIHSSELAIPVENLEGIIHEPPNEHTRQNSAQPPQELLFHDVCAITSSQIPIQVKGSFFSKPFDN